jgi:hypothetical protein
LGDEQGARVGRLWQVGYHEHIVRTERDLEAIREYIRSNPIVWEGDPENSARTKWSRAERDWEV